MREKQLQSTLTLSLYWKFPCWHANIKCKFSKAHNSKVEYSANNSHFERYSRKEKTSSNIYRDNIHILKGRGFWFPCSRNFCNFPILIFYLKCHTLSFKLICSSTFSYVVRVDIYSHATCFLTLIFIIPQKLCTHSLSSFIGQAALKNQPTLQGESKMVWNVIKHVKVHTCSIFD